ncbi:alpha/beta family hydrolase [Methylobacter sp. BBA5.1]|uniref:alpha/beta hydrolase family protein n=1 Tax=Methylobacter sp. BBA5.1 TaxID=1495064 RepID=UPI00068E85AB|nr:alpha/beta family hydrolase [Methylobacter sp. BBA5.1]
MKPENHLIKVNNNTEISSVWLIPEQYQHALIIAHGAGNDMHSGFISTLHEGIAEADILTVKFNFPYMEQGRKAPDRPAVLEATWQAVIDAVLERTRLAPDKLVLSGKSMGGRYASMIAAQRPGFGGVILFGYPLHAAGKADKLRAGHLSSISAPLLFFQGTRDALCQLDQLQTVLKALPVKADLLIIEGGDHSFKVLKRLNRSEQAVMDEVIKTSAAWIQRLGAG